MPRPSVDWPVGHRHCRRPLPVLRRVQLGEYTLSSVGVLLDDNADSDPVILPAQIDLSVGAISALAGSTDYTQEGQYDVTWQWA